jgi:ribose transport system substrate-binding protein
MDNIPNGFVPGQNYISDVSADNYGNGVVSCLLMAKALHGKGEIGLIYHGADFFVTRQRYEGFKAIIAKYPGIKIVAEQGIVGPDFTGDAEKAASAILTSHPKVNGLWAVWDVPAEGVLSAARAAGREPSGLAVTTCDLGANIAIDMAQDGFAKEPAPSGPSGRQKPRRYSPDTGLSVRRRRPMSLFLRSQSRRKTFCLTVSKRLCNKIV